MCQSTKKEMLNELLCSYVCVCSTFSENDKEKSMTKNLVERLNQGPVICAEGFLFEIERRGYLSAGEFVPTVALDRPDVLESLHRDFQHAGSDVVQAQH